MDAKPCRPRGVENAMPPLHQRHKSTGNLISATSMPTGGFCGPARRAAFGDVTNMPRHGGDYLDDAKIIKKQSSAIFPQAGPELLNKENVPLNNKKALARPAQRPVVLSTKNRHQPSHLADATRIPPPRDPTQAADRAAISSDIARQQLTDVPSSKEDALIAQASLAAQPLQPRHHKSQPQLKVQQPTLRRTQSRQWEKSIAAVEEVSLQGTASRLEDVANEETKSAEPSIVTALQPEAAARESSASHESWNTQTDSAHSTVDLKHPCESNRDDGAQPSFMELHRKLSNISEEIVVAGPTFRDASAPLLSEPEEYWDDEEYEECDEQDQAYTTAHSFRSRDMTTGGVTTLLAPRITSQVRRELEEARIEVVRTRPREDIEEEEWDVSMVAEYGDEIFDYMRELENKMLPNPHYMDIQTEIQWSMRSILMDWLVQVHGRFSLLPETLFLTVNYIDRFLSSKVVSLGKLQLVGATAILVASKYEEINCPSLQEIVYMVDGGYSMDEIIKAERFMLSMLGFELGWPGPMSFLRRVSKADDYDLDTRTLAKYFLELTIMDERFVSSPPSYLAAGAHCLSRLILKKGDWSKAHVHYSGYTWSQLKSVVAMMIGCCEQPELHHGAVFEKYSEGRFKAASVTVQKALDAGFVLPNHYEPVRASSRVYRVAPNFDEASYARLSLPIET